MSGPPIRFMSSFRLRLTPLQHVWIDRVARERAVSRAEVIRGLLRSELERLSAAERAQLKAAAAEIFDDEPADRRAELPLPRARPASLSSAPRRPVNGERVRIRSRRRAP